MTDEKRNAFHDEIVHRNSTIRAKNALNFFNNILCVVCGLFILDWFYMQWVPLVVSTFFNGMLTMMIICLYVFERSNLDHVIAMNRLIEDEKR